MKKVIWFAIFLVTIVIAAWSALWYTGYFHTGPVGTSLSASAAGARPLTAQEQTTMSDVMSKVVEESAPPLGTTYTNKTHKFSVQIPEGFTSQELAVDENGGTAIVLQDQKGNGVQIYITPDKSGAASLSADDVRASLPEMRVVDAQDVELGTEKGVAFMSDNDAFSGASREVWFYFHGNLYQISTYARLDPLLQSMFGTWKFY